MVRCLLKREDDNGLNKQLGKPQIVFDLFFLEGGGQEWCIEGVSERCLKWGCRIH